MKGYCPRCKKVIDEVEYDIKNNCCFGCSGVERKAIETFLREIDDDDVRYMKLTLILFIFLPPIILLIWMVLI